MSAPTFASPTEAALATEPAADATTTASSSATEATASHPVAEVVDYSVAVISAEASRAAGSSGKGYVELPDH